MTSVPEVRLGLQIVNLSKKYAWHRAPRDASDDDPDLADEDEAPVEEIEPGGERWALRGISATIKPGERVGIIGSNGAGKSTLLNILAGVTLPSGGCVRGSGLRVLLNSLRRPFRGHLTGRQNLHILAALLGVDAARLEPRLPDILAFSDMEHLIDRRVAQYSSQQYQRLAFAAALMLDPEIILSDDTLGIGDARYQQKAERLIAQKAEKDGVIFMFASNRLGVIQELCTRVIWLEEGLVAADGPAEEVIMAFMDADKTDGDAEEAEDSTAAVPVTALSAMTGSSVSATTVDGDAEDSTAAAPVTALSAMNGSSASATTADGDAEDSTAAAPVTALSTMNGSSASATAAEPPLPPAEDAIERRKMDERWVVRWAKDSLFLQEELEQRRPRHPSPSLSELSSATAAAAIQPDSHTDSSRIPVPEWARLAAKATRRRKRIEQKWMARLAEGGRMLLSIDKWRPSLPGLGTLEEVSFKLAGTGPVADKSSLEIVLKVDKPDTEVSVTVEGVHGQNHVFTSELPVPLIAPKSGTYFLTVEIDDALLRPRTLEREYTKGRLRICAYLRLAGTENWAVLRGDLRFILPGEPWNPLSPYPAGQPGPILKPILGWSVQMSPGELDASDAAPQDMALTAGEARTAQTPE